MFKRSFGGASRTADRASRGPAMPALPSQTLPSAAISL
jgi:hypothetical protein